MTFTSGRYRLKNVESGSYLNIGMDSLAKLAQLDPDNNEQLYDIEPEGEGYYIQQVYALATLVGIEESPVKDGSPVVSVAESKHWQIKDSGDAFVIQDPASGFVITGGAKVGAEISVASLRSDDKTQLWTFEDADINVGNAPSVF